MKYEVEPWKHQLKSINVAKDRDFYGLFFEMGCGKTATAINILRHWWTAEGAPMPTLILCPLIVKENWRREFEMHAPNIADRCIVLKGKGELRMRALLRVDRVPIIITNIDTLNMPSVWRHISNMDFKIVIIDESHKFKNPAAKRTQKLLAWLKDKKPEKRLILSGSPVLNTPMDLWSQIQILSTKIFNPNFYAWRAEYFYDMNAGMPKKQYFPLWKPQKDASRRLNIAIKKYSSRVEKKNVLDLPPLLKVTVDCLLSTPQNKLYRQMKQDLVAYLETKEGDIKVSVADLAITKALRMQQLITGIFKDDTGEVTILDTPRTKALHDLLQDIPKNDKVIVWCVFKENYKQVADVCDALWLRHTFLTGLQNEKEKLQAVDDFNNDNTTKVLIANPAAGGVGINLTRSNYSIYFSRNFSLESDLQSEARNHRGGQTKTVTRIDIVAPGTIDEVMMEALATKMSVAEAIMKVKNQHSEINAFSESV